MSVVQEKSIKSSISMPLMVSGKNLVKLQSIRSQSRINISTFDKGVKIEVPDKDVSFIQEILGRNSENTNWSVNIEKKRKKVTLLYIEKDDEEDKPNSKINTLTSTLPYIQESSISSQKRTHKKSKTKPVLLKPLRSPLENYKFIINSLRTSNGFELIRPKKSYKYYIGSGNNDSLVNKVMYSKIGWMRVYNHTSANFIWTQVKKKEIMETIPKNEEVLEKNKSSFNVHIRIFGEEKYTEILPVAQIESSKLRVYNRIDRNRELSSKKRLFKNLKSFYTSKGDDVFKYIPLTFHIKRGSRDPAFSEFKEAFLRIQDKIDNDNDIYLTNAWLVKPGELTNRGIGISVCTTIKEIIDRIDDLDSGTKHQRTYIIQKYIYRPLLYKNRKFDIRCYALITCYNSNLQGFFYKDGYLRTSVAEFSLENAKNKFIHLTNDAVQKKSSEYGKYEDGNKLSYPEFQEYLETIYGKSVNFFENILPGIKNLVKDSIQSTYKKLNPKDRLHTFEILGYDFMIDEFFKPWLIEVNTNPCLALSGPYLAVLIPKMLTDAFHIALDPFFSHDFADFDDNRFVMVFNKATADV
ncbi:hypothetical protein SteCoe_30394 [Stentor coeruleus]|uniref:Tubulin--tyrosine ligase-like protein 9 n=1 Tax=Stentor coeruleus TaxID=5963 RepID=A0A1R2B3M4_9CILI|nr:hypothetical protein SteCoe_30418 [Stentor coeruleus]OMJ71403.1 hypothetical protein SteCoe_30394 [Stentor coeruleus]